ncbi:MAG: HAD-IA family hydrolase [Gemmatales bacterium]
MRRLLLLDLDGTLIDTLSFIIHCFQQSVTPLTRRVPSQEEIVATFGPAEVDCIARLLRRYDSEGLLHQPLNMQQVYQAADCFHAMYAAGYHEGKVLPYPHIVETIHAARKWGWATAVFTGKGRTSTDETLAHLGLTASFDAIITSDDIAHPKPAPDGVLLACEQTGVAPAQTYFVGDSPTDIHAGKAAGAHSVAAMWGAIYPEETLSASPETILHHPSELQSWLQRITV